MKLLECFCMGCEKHRDCSSKTNMSTSGKQILYTNLLCNKDGGYKVQTNWEEFTIDDEIYYRLSNDLVSTYLPFYPYKSKKKKFDSHNPTLLRITSPNIEHTICNGSYDQCLREFTCNDFDVYKSIEFDNLEYFNVESTSINSFEAKIVDQNNHLLRLRKGKVTWISLIFKPAACSDMINVRISSQPTTSFPENSIADFKVELPKVLDFKHVSHPKLALTRVSFRNTWSVMPERNLDFCLYITEDVDPIINAEREPIKSYYFNLPTTGVYDGTSKSIFDWFTHALSESGPQEFIDLRSVDDNCIKIVFKKKCVLAPYK